MNPASTCLELGNHFQNEGNYAAALQAFDQAVQSDATFAPAFFNRGNLRKLQGELQDALSDFNQAIKLDPSNADFFNNRGLLLYELDQITDSKTDFETALQLRPSFKEVMNNLALWHQCQGEPDRALYILNQALDLYPDFSAAYCNRGNLYLDQGLLDQAKADFDNAIRLSPHEAQPYLAKSMALLLEGSYPEGFSLQEWRWKTSSRPFAQDLSQAPLLLTKPLLESLSSLAKKRILVQSEQGLGDTIQFCRYLPLLEAVGAQVSFAVEPHLIPLLRSLSATIELLPKRTDLSVDEGFDYYCPLLSLPFLFNTTLQSIPNQALAYLKADPLKAKRWSESIRSDHLLKVGLVWSGAPRPMQMFYRGFNQLRDIPLAQFAALSNPDYALYSLQIGARAKTDIQATCDLFKPSPIIDLTGHIEDFSDTAALVANLDVVVSVDTSIVHLAAALGKPTLLLNRKASCWRWGISGQKSPWYPTIQILRQKQLGSWTDVLQEASVRLAKMCQNIPGI